MTTNDIFRTLIVPDVNVGLARAIAASFGPGGDGMWITPLSPTGYEPATHYISTGLVPPEYGYLVPCQTWTQGEDGDWIMTGEEPGNPEAVYAHCVETGVECTQAPARVAAAPEGVCCRQAPNGQVKSVAAAPGAASLRPH